jgi:hypothetical protein
LGREQFNEFASEIFNRVFDDIDEKVRGDED